MSTAEITRVRQILLKNAPAVLNNQPVLLCYLYGSFAREDIHCFSDIDIGIYVKKMSSEKMLDIELSLALEFDDIIGYGCNVDVRSINNMPLVMKGKIVTEGILLYSHNDPFCIEFETSVRKEYFDFRPFIIQYQNTYLANCLTGT
jgi:predicted nucleotidyltransferase